MELHRNSLVPVLVLGGTSMDRSRVARAFHERSPLRAGAFVAVDARSDEASLRAALLEWLGIAGCPAPEGLRASERGTLFVDGIEALSAGTQRLLLALATASPRESGGAWRGRLMAGSECDLARQVREGGFQTGLFDFLDKVRIELSPPAPEVLV